MACCSGPVGPGTWLVCFEFNILVWFEAGFLLGRCSCLCSPAEYFVCALIYSGIHP